MLVLALDPGKKGGIAAQRDGGEVTVYKMPDTTIGLVNLIEYLCGTLSDRRAYVEKVGFHVQGNAAQASVKLANHVGEIHGVLAALRFQIIRVNPAQWEKAFIGTPPVAPKSADYNSHKAFLAAKRRASVNRKNAIKAKAQELFPNIKVTLQISDALGILIACTDGTNKPKPCTMREGLLNRKRYAKAGKTKTEVPGQAKRNRSSKA